ncbi:MAG: AmmeMemoRadiSam system radical SAM enzyme [Salinivirgaceae bacterium]|nr:AmmeMemoRadiSam system radical SAM enzyme [Salinivirgaceae bacterium]
MFYQKVKRKIQCLICPHQCILQEGKAGICGVRYNIGGRIRNKQQGLLSSMAFDPIEKKPLYHFYPGAEILSLGGFGCNLHCNFCQNWQISQVAELDHLHGKIFTSAEVIAKALERPSNIGVAFTYNEPTVWFEFMHEVASLAKAHGLKTVMISNGYINSAPLEALLPLIDAFNIDLKAFTENFYYEMAGGKLAPVLESLKLITNYKKHLEITNLIIPNKNDNPEQFIEMVQWIRKELGKDTVLHLSKYFPRYKQNIHPTPEDTLTQFYELAKKELHYVYLGNFHQSRYSSTNCPECNQVLIHRNGYKIQCEPAFDGKYCPNCKSPISLIYDIMT